MIPVEQRREIYPHSGKSIFIPKERLLILDGFDRSIKYIKHPDSSGTIGRKPFQWKQCIVRIDADNVKYERKNDEITQEQDNRILVVLFSEPWEFNLFAIVTYDLSLRHKTQYRNTYEIEHLVVSLQDQNDTDIGVYRTDKGQNIPPSIKVESDLNIYAVDNTNAGVTIEQTNLNNPQTQLSDTQINYYLTAVNSIFHNAVIPVLVKVRELVGNPSFFGQNY